MTAKKTFTSVQQGGSIKMGAQAGANASQTQKPVDLSTVGLTSTFGGGGARSKLAQAVQGAGGIIGDANQATGTAGFAKDRPGDDLGSAFKDTGAGGNGVAIEGIRGGVTNGRGSGNAGYGGVGSGLGDKSGVQVDVGGYGASFAGTIDKNGVRRVILSKQAVIRRCYEKELRFKKSLGGRVVVKFEITDTGRVSAASVSESTLGDAGVENCLKNELVTWQFPPTPENTVADVLFPFNFQSKE
jgi:TonB family protein